MCGSRKRKEKRKGKEGVRTARCPVIMTGLCGCAEEKSRVVFQFYWLWSTSGALSPDTGKKKRSGWFCQRKEGCPRIMIQLQGRIRCQKRESLKAAVVFIRGGGGGGLANYAASRLFVLYLIRL